MYLTCPALAAGHVKVGREGERERERGTERERKQGCKVILKKHV